MLPAVEIWRSGVNRCLIGALPSEATYATKSMMAYYCGPCNQQFPSQRAYAEHAAALHTLSHKCAQCGRLFRSEQALSEHVTVIHPIQPLSRPLPKPPAAKPAQKQLLQKPDATQPLSKPLPTPPALEQLACQDCTVSFVTQQGLLDHRALIHPSCLDCKRAFASQIALQQHRIHVHSRSSSQAAPAVVLPKPKNQHALQLHSAYLQKVRSSCGNDQQVQQHALANVSKGSGAPGEQGFDCEECEKRFLSLAALEQHAKDTKGHKREFQCRVCDLVFLTKAGLGQHCNGDVHRMRVANNGVKGESSSGMVPGKLPNGSLSAPSVVRCDVCNKDFETLQRLAQHRKDTPGHAQRVVLQSSVRTLPPNPGFGLRKPSAAQAGGFACRPCQKEFASQAALDQHFSNSTVHAEADDRFACGPCGAVFASSAELERHKLALPSHVETFVCKECDKTFKSGPALSQHLRDIHKQRVLVESHQNPKFVPASKQPQVYKPTPSDTMKKVSKMIEKRLAELPVQASIEPFIDEWRPGASKVDVGSQFDGRAFDGGESAPNGHDQNGDLVRGPEEEAGTDARVQEVELEVQAASVATAQAAPEGASAVAGGTVRHEDECIICLDARRDTLYLPCGHFCFCHECAVHNQEKGNPCPQCRTPIDLLLKVLA
ncbi:hypothetical protein KFL_000630300 [Klebsormidium nitens]|uniref:Uncharacterized protein n=1 Tax=Klebsormidium nitens TaxID=105231 RepID=A0A1Y1HY99_KLENI|nr:hypothetical protein KFL_000630300 [Klebsormidium nitens]|eukprot:GAQ80828.1 hypothetical protein KFL_000630300 [Klebsormidium nitens]